MAVRNMPGIGLKGGWETNADGWGEDMNANLRTLSGLVQLSVKSATVALPSSPTQGDIYILPSGTDANKVAIYDESAWIYLTPSTGWRAYVLDQSKFVYFTGSAWADESSGGGGGDGIPDAPSDGKLYGRKNAAWAEVPTSGGGNGGGGSAAFNGAMVRLDVSKSLAPPLLVPWDSALYDTGSFWSAANPTRLTVPAGVNKIRLYGCVRPGSLGVNQSQVVQFQKNGSSFVGDAVSGAIVGYSDVAFSIVSPPIPVMEGDYFELRYNNNNNTAKPIGTASYFAIEVVDPVPSTSAASAAAISLFAEGIYESSETLLSYLVTFAGTLPVSLTGSIARAQIAPTADTSLSIQHNGTSVGSINFAAAANAGTFTFTSGVTLVEGDVLSIIAPATADTTLAGVSVTLKATL